MLKVGDIVKLREDSEHWGQSRGETGVIIECFDHDYVYRIRWKCKYADRYRAHDVDLAAQTWKQRMLQ